MVMPYVNTKQNTRTCIVTSAGIRKPRTEPTYTTVDLTLRRLFTTVKLGKAIRDEM